MAAAIPAMVDPAQPEPEAIDALRALCRDPDPDTRYYALHGLTEEGLAIPFSTLEDTLAALVSDPDEQVRQLAAEAQQRVK